MCSMYEYMYRSDKAVVNTRRCLHLISCSSGVLFCYLLDDILEQEANKIDVVVEVGLVCELNNTYDDSVLKTKKKKK
jgi:hypothetical protein